MWNAAQAAGCPLRPAHAPCSAPGCQLTQPGCLQLKCQVKLHHYNSSKHDAAYIPPRPLYVLPAAAPYPHGVYMLPNGTNGQVGQRAGRLWRSMLRPLEHPPPAGCGAGRWLTAWVALVSVDWPLRAGGVGSCQARSLQVCLAPPCGRHAQHQGECAASIHTSDCAARAVPAAPALALLAGHACPCFQTLMFPTMPTEAPCPCCLPSLAVLPCLPRPRTL